MGSASKPSSPRQSSSPSEIVEVVRCHQILCVVGQSMIKEVTNTPRQIASELKNASSGAGIGCLRCTRYPNSARTRACWGVPLEVRYPVCSARTRAWLEVLPPAGIGCLRCTRYPNSARTRACWGVPLEVRYPVCSARTRAWLEVLPPAGIGCLRCTRYPNRPRTRIAHDMPNHQPGEASCPKHIKSSHFRLKE
jgi:hypothetical protein